MNKTKIKYRCSKCEGEKMELHGLYCPLVFKKLKILNVYSGIGGNRKLWGDQHEIVAVENNPKIAAIYKDFFPKDEVIVADAHQYLLEHFEEFDFIWSSPPCPTHSRMSFLQQAKGNKMKYPDMKLYEEIIFLKQFFKGKWVVENVKSYYESLIKPQISGGHYFWSNFYINNVATRKKVRNDMGLHILDCAFRQNKKLL